jgi:hypothetical protein
LARKLVKALAEVAENARMATEAISRHDRLVSPFR